jgi:hypothetical protein
MSFLKMKFLIITQTSYTFVTLILYYPGQLYVRDINPVSVDDLIPYCATGLSFQYKANPNLFS